MLRIMFYVDKNRRSRVTIIRSGESLRKVAQSLKAREVLGSIKLDFGDTSLALERFVCDSERSGQLEEAMESILEERCRAESVESWGDAKTLQYILDGMNRHNLLHLVD